MMKSFLADLSRRQGMQIDYFEETTSTNDVARMGDYKEGALIVAESQGAGRGQRGNQWCSAPRLNLTFSLVLHPNFLAPSHQFRISQVTALALTDTLAEVGIEARIKWPNDIYVGDRKICGILIEQDILGTELSRSVVGVGLNVNQCDFPTELPNPIAVATCLGHELSRGVLLETFHRVFFERYECLRAGAQEALHADYLARLYRFDGQSYPFRSESGESFAGILVDVEPAGELVLRHEPIGNLSRYRFKEIEFVLPR